MEQTTQKPLISVVRWYFYTPYYTTCLFGICQIQISYFVVKIIITPTQLKAKDISSQTVNIKIVKTKFVIKNKHSDILKCNECQCNKIFNYKRSDDGAAMASGSKLNPEAAEFVPSMRREPPLEENGVTTTSL